MFLRRCYRRHAGKRYAYWALVETRRTERGPRQQVIAYLGDVEEAAGSGLLAAASGQSAWQPVLPGLGVEPEEPEWVEVDAKRVRIERSRAFGGAWIGLEVARRLGLPEFLREHVARGREEIPWSLMALVLVLGRLCDPSSELALAERVYERTALPELLGIPAAKVNDDRLYRALDRLLPAKNELEKHLRARLGELFGTTYDLLLYDVTSTFFEGQAARNPQAQRGYSRDQRSDCKQVCIALIVTREGLPVGYEVFAGNRNDATTVEEIVGAMEARHGVVDRIWVMDRGMASEANLDFLREGGRRYIIGTHKSQMRRWEAELASGGWSEVHAGLEVKLCAGPDGTETFILCRSANRRDKEQAMRERAAQRLESGLTSLASACEKRPQRLGHVHERIGRLRERCSRASRMYEVGVTESEPGQVRVTWRRRDGATEWADLAEGCYVLRSNVRDWSAEELWQAYTQLTEAEAAFRIQKDDLALRPVWHQTEERVQAHILVCFLGYVIWKTLGQMAKAAGLGDCPRQLFDELSQLRMVDVVLPTRNGVEIRRRCVERPGPHQTILLERLKLQPPKSMPMQPM